MLVGNKLDLEAARKTPREMGEEYAREEGLLFAEASAKSGDGVEDLFMEIGRSSSSSPCACGIGRADNYS
jgi:Ras-related protein Rab-5C